MYFNSFKSFFRLTVLSVSALTNSIGLESLVGHLLLIMNYQLLPPQPKKLMAQNEAILRLTQSTDNINTEFVRLWHFFFLS